ncbi:copper resistance protein NlpE [Novilysobacter erysipheiresistens]|uniref:Copper resistance protein NlpE n=1 Tax=Novilysobacter erysipheiresistens TaxID=1749332 RepID=A0ABU7YV73_9GAMM
MTKPLLALACLTVFALAACKPEPAEPAVEVPTAAETAAVDITPAGEAFSSDNAGFDMKGFAGTFSGTLPCADCPGIDITLVLNPDGSYDITEVYQDEQGPAMEMDGTWTVEANAQQIRLDPNSKSEQDRLFAITSQQQITQLDLEGKPAESGLDYSLSRQPAN